MNPHEHYRFDDIQIEKELYCLLCCFLASPRLNELALEDYERKGNEGIDVLNMFLNAFEKQNIQELLISIAVKLRMIDDRFNIGQEKDINGELNDVGSLTKKHGETKEEILTIRDACNKIIHAVLIEYNLDWLEVRGKKKRCLKTELLLYDKADKSGWKAKIDIIKFVRVGTNVCELYNDRSYSLDV